MFRSRFRQCTLRKQLTGSRSIVTTSFIHERFAHLGSIIKLRDDVGAWSNGWRVEHVGVTMEAEELPDAHQGIKRHRHTTGDDVPRQRC